LCDATIKSFTYYLKYNHIGVGLN